MILCSIAIAAGMVGLAGITRRLILGRHACRGDHAGHGGRMFRRSFGPGFRRGIGRSFWLRGIFESLDTTPGQEREIRAALEGFRDVALSAKEHFAATREDLARAVSGETFNAVAIAEAGTRLDDATSRTKEAFAAALEKVHAILDPKQRERLAELLRQKGKWGRFGGGGPYRGGGAPEAA